MVARGLHRDSEVGRDLLRRPAAREEAQHLRLPRSQRGTGTGVSGDRPETRDAERADDVVPVLQPRVAQLRPVAPAVGSDERDGLVGDVPAPENDARVILAHGAHVCGIDEAEERLPHLLAEDLARSRIRPPERARRIDDGGRERQLLERILDVRTELVERLLWAFRQAPRLLRARRVPPSPGCRRARGTSSPGPGAAAAPPTTRPPHGTVSLRGCRPPP